MKFKGLFHRQDGVYTVNTAESPGNYKVNTKLLDKREHRLSQELQRGDSDCLGTLHKCPSKVSESQSMKHENWLSILR